MATARQRLGFGIGIAYGYATLGRVGFENRFDYTAIGSVVDLAARLCEKAGPGDILIDNKVKAAIEGLLETEVWGESTPKGFSRPVEVVNISLENSLIASSQAQTLRVDEGALPSRIPFL